MANSTLLDPAARQAIAARLRGLTPDAKAQWGKFTAPRMVTHLIDSSRMALGEIKGLGTGKPILSWPGSVLENGCRPIGGTMCLGVPGRVVEIREDGVLRIARVLAAREEAAEREPDRAARIAAATHLHDLGVRRSGGHGHQADCRENPVEPLPFHH